MPAADLYPYVYVNADGTARELHPSEQKYLETRVQGRRWRRALCEVERRVGKGATRRAHVVKPRGLRCAQPTLHIRLIG